MPKRTRASLIEQLQAFQKGVQTTLASTKVVIDNVTYTGAQLDALLDEAIESTHAIDVARIQAAAAIVADQAVQRRIGPTLRGLRDLVHIMFRNDHVVLAGFGLTARKARTPLTNEKKVLREARVRATRKVRNTRGSKQKKAIKGSVTGVTITPIVQPAAPGTSEPTE